MAYRSCSLCGALALLISAHGAFALTGKAAVVVAQKNVYASSKLLVVHVSNNVVTATDTILRGGVFYGPRWSFDGSRIAFYRNGGGVSIIDSDGKNLRTVARTVDWNSPDQEYFIDWPGSDGGKWVYYDKPCLNCFNLGSGEIWRVNVNDTAQKQMLCDLKRDNSSTYICGFHLSSDAKYAAMEIVGTTAQLGYDKGTDNMVAFTFPPQVDQSTGYVTSLNQANTSNSNFGGCNAAISASGNILYNFLGGHAQIYSSLWNHTSNTATRYTIGTGGSGSLDLFKDVGPELKSGQLPGECFSHPVGSCNSDQVITSIIFWQYGVGTSGRETNQMVVNWKEKTAVFTTNIPDSRKLPSGPMTNFFWVDVGDFWVDGGAANPGNKYQDVNGNWIVVPGAAVAVDDNPNSRRARWESAKAIDGTTAIYDCMGKRLGDISGNSAMQGKPHAGVFLIRTSAEDGNSARWLAVGGQRPTRD